MRFTSTLALILATMSVAACGGDDGGPSVIDARRIDSSGGGPDTASACPFPETISLGAGTLNLTRNDSTSNPAAYSLTLGALLGMDTPPDAMFLEFYNTYAPFGTSAAPGAIGPGTYTIDAVQASYETCGACMQIHANFDTMTGDSTNVYMPNGGSITVTELDPALGGTYSLTFNNLTMREVTIAPMTFVTTDVPGGCTTTVTDGSLTGTIAAPMANKIGPVLQPRVRR